MLMFRKRTLLKEKLWNSEFVSFERWDLLYEERRKVEIKLQVEDKNWIKRNEKVKNIKNDV